MSSKTFHWYQNHVHNLSLAELPMHHVWQVVRARFLHTLTRYHLEKYTGIPWEVQVSGFSVLKTRLVLNITALTPRASLGNHNIWYRTVKKHTKYLSSSRWSISQRCRLAGAAGILRWSWFSARIVQHLRLQGKNINCHSSFLTGKTDLHFPEGFLKCLLSWLNLLKKDDLQSLSIYFTVARPVLLNVFK